MNLIVGMQPVTPAGGITEQADFSSKYIRRDVLFTPAFKPCQNVEGKIPPGLIFNQRKPVESRCRLTCLKACRGKAKLIQITAQAKGTAQTMADTEIKPFFIARHTRLFSESGSKNGLKRFVVIPVGKSGIGIFSDFNFCSSQHPVGSVIGIAAFSK